MTCGLKEKWSPRFRSAAVSLFAAVLLAGTAGCGKSPGPAGDLSGEETRRQLLGKWQDVGDRSNHIEFLDGGAYLQKFRIFDFGRPRGQGPGAPPQPPKDDVPPKPQFKEITGTYEVADNGSIKTTRITSDGETMYGTFRIVKDELQRIKTEAAQNDGVPSIIARYRRPEKLNPPADAEGP